MAKSLLVVDDEKDIVDLMEYHLAKEGYRVLKAYDGEEALRVIRAEKPDLLLLDLMLPGIQGLELCRLLRKSPEHHHLPIIMVTAKGEVIDKVVGLEMGADDYLPKPFSVRELVARVKALLRRQEFQTEPGAAEIFESGRLRIDYAAHEVCVDARKVDLSPTEFNILKFLARHPGRVYSRDQLLNAVWGADAFVEPRTVDVHIKRLRAQIEKIPSHPEFVLTVRGVGYKFAERP